MIQKYKLIHTQTKEETICEKVTIDSFDYYIENGNIVKPIDFSKWQYSKHANLVFIGEPNALKGEYYEVLATNNFNIDIPKVIDEVEYLFKLAKDHSDKCGLDNFLDEDDIQIIKEHYTHGYKKSKETYQFTEQDMIEFTKWFNNVTESDWELNKKCYNETSLHTVSLKSKIELLEIWKSEQLTIIYYK